MTWRHSVRDLSGTMFCDTYMAFLPLARILQWFMLIPFEFASSKPSYVNPLEDETTIREVYPHTGTKFGKKICVYVKFLVSAFSVFALLPLSTWYVIYGYASKLKDPAERYFTTAYVIVECCCICFTCLMSIIPARKKAFRILLGQWRSLDRSLGIREDSELALCSRRLLRRFVLINILGLLVVMILAIVKGIDVKVQKGAREISNPFVLLPLAVCTLYLTTTLGGTEVLLYFHCKTVLLRTRCIRQRIMIIVKHTRKPEMWTRSTMKSNLEACRLSLEALRSVASSTSQFVSPMLLCSTIIGVATLVGSTVGLIQQESGNFGFSFFKVGIGFFAFCNILLLVRATTYQHGEAKKLYNTLQSASTVFIDRQSQFQLYLMMVNLKYLPLEFSACGFFSLSPKFLQAVIGIILTCLLTAVDFERDSAHGKPNAVQG